MDENDDGVEYCVFCYNVPEAADAETLASAVEGHAHTCGAADRLLENYGIRFEVVEVGINPNVSKAPRPDPMERCQANGRGRAAARGRGAGPVGGRGARQEPAVRRARLRFRTEREAEAIVKESGRLRVLGMSVSLKAEPPRKERFRDETSPGNPSFGVTRAAIGVWAGGVTGPGKVFVQTWEHPGLHAPRTVGKGGPSLPKAQPAVAPRLHVSFCRPEAFALIISDGPNAPGVRRLKMQATFKDLSTLSRYPVSATAGDDSDGTGRDASGPRSLSVRLYLTLQRPPRVYEYVPTPATDVRPDLHYQRDDHPPSVFLPTTWAGKWARHSPAMFCCVATGGVRFGGAESGVDGDVLALTFDCPTETARSALFRRFKDLGKVRPEDEAQLRSPGAILRHDLATMGPWPPAVYEPLPLPVAKAAKGGAKAKGGGKEGGKGGGKGAANGSPATPITSGCLTDALAHAAVNATLAEPAVHLARCLIASQKLPEFFAEPAGGGGRGRRRPRTSSEFVTDLAALPPAVCLEVLRYWCAFVAPPVDPAGAGLASAVAVARGRLDDGLGDAPTLVLPAGMVLERSLLVSRVRVTPLKIHCLPPELETGNRVTRYFASLGLLDCLVRVMFCEETGDLLNVYDLRQSPSVVDRIRRVLTDGLVTTPGGTRRFVFLAYSSSQLREASLWMFCGRGDWTADAVRTWMGDFTHERVIAKAAARMGQCFSATIGQSDSLVEEEWVEAKDVTAGPYLFSDGCGTLPLSTAVALAGRLRLNYVPSAFQIRFMGAKGMVSAWPHTDVLTVRESMIKFSSDHKVLEVIQPSAWLPGHLNRQFITLLSTLGVPNEHFMTLQKQHLHQMSVAVGENPLAARLAASQLLKEAAGNDRHGVLSEARAMLDAGFGADEPYLARIVRAVRACSLAEMRTKARIRVPLSALLFGIMDELGVLQPGQVFCQVEPVVGRPPCVINKPVIVCKAPCVHPGDVRLLTAVDRPELRHLTNVVVFPKQGLRPHPSEMSGGDLDGDMYFVCWEPTLQVPRKGTSVAGRGLLLNHGVEPMDYARKAPLTVPAGCDIGVPDFVDHFLSAIQNDVLGMVANAWVVVADQAPDQALCDKCVLLAQLHSDAVDFQKTGLPVAWDSQLRVHGAYPDFMAKKDKVMYQSKRVLGKLYRALGDECDEAPLRAALAAAEAAETEALWAASGEPGPESVDGSERSVLKPAAQDSESESDSEGSGFGGSVSDEGDDDEGDTEPEATGGDEDGSETDDGGVDSGPAEPFVAAMLTWPGAADWTDSALALKALYEFDFTSLQRRFGDDRTSEGELLSGCVLKFNRFLRGSRNQKKVEEERANLRTAVARLRSTYRARFWRGVAESVHGDGAADTDSVGLGDSDAPVVFAALGREMRAAATAQVLMLLMLV